MNNIIFKNQLRKKLKYLKSIYNSVSDNNKRIIEGTIEDINYILNFGKNKSERADNDILLEERSFLKENQSALDLIKPFINSTPIELGIEPSSVKLSIDDMYSIIYDFFKAVLSKKMFMYFDYLFKNRKKLFHFYPSNTDENDMEIYLEFFHEPHILIISKSSVAQISSICHEIGHALLDMSNDSYHNCDSIILEILSMHYDLFCLVFLLDFPFLENLAKDKLQFYYNHYSDVAKIISFHQIFFKHYNENTSKENLENMNQYLRLKNTDPYLDYVFNQGILFTEYSSQKLKYLIGKSVEQALLILYIQDKERYQYIIKQLFQLNWDRAFEEIIEDLEKLDIISTEKTIEEYKKIILSPSQYFR